MTENEKKIKIVRDMILFGFVIIDETPEHFAQRHSLASIQIMFEVWVEKINKWN